MVPPELDPIEEQHLDKCRGNLRPWYIELRNFVFGLGSDISVFAHASRRCTTFSRNRAFAYFNCQPRLKRIAIDIPDPGDKAESETGILIPWSGQREGKAVRIVVDDAGDLQEAKTLLERAYTDST
jgi:hypothetical protein